MRAFQRCRGACLMFVCAHACTHVYTHVCTHTEAGLSQCSKGGAKVVVSREDDSQPLMRRRVRMLGEVSDVVANHPRHEIVNVAVLLGCAHVQDSARTQGIHLLSLRLEDCRTQGIRARQNKKTMATLNSQSSGPSLWPQWFFSRNLQATPSRTPAQAQLACGPAMQKLVVL